MRYYFTQVIKNFKPLSLANVKSALNLNNKRDRREKHCFVVQVEDVGMRTGRNTFLVGPSTVWSDGEDERKKKKNCKQMVKV